MTKELEKELLETFDENMAKDFKDYDGYISVDWKEGTEEKVEEIFKALGASFKRVNIGDADLYFYKRFSDTIKANIAEDLCTLILSKVETNGAGMRELLSKIEERVL